MKTILTIMLLALAFTATAGGTISFSGAIVNGNGPSNTAQTVVTSTTDPLLSYAMTRVNAASVLVKTVTYQ